MKKELNIISNDDISITTDYNVSDKIYQIGGSNLVFDWIPPSSAIDFNTNVLSHKWSILGLYSKSDLVKFTVPYTAGGVDFTYLENIAQAYNTSGMYTGNIDSSVFRAGLEAHNMRITIPISGGTGTLSGLTSLDLYTAITQDSNSQESDGSGVCATWVADSLMGESYRPSTSAIGIGESYNPNNKTHNSGLMYLFSEKIYLSGNTGTTWSTGWSGTSKYTFGGGELATFNGPTRNLAVGLVDLWAGHFTLWDPTIVDAFNTGIATGGTATSGLTFSITDASMYIRDRDVSVEVGVKTILLPNQFTESKNSSVLDAKEQGLTCDTVNFTKICYYDAAGQVVAFAALDVPLTKNVQDYVVLNSTFAMDGGILTALPDTVGYGGISFLPGTT